MGTKVNIFLASVVVYGIVLGNFNMEVLFGVLVAFTLVYKHYKVWQFTGKFPGKNFSPEWKTFLGNSASNFHRELHESWVKHGRDKFITWIGFERFIAVSKLNDVQAILKATDDAPLMANYQQMWPWLGGDDAIKTSEFSSKALVNSLVNDGPFLTFTQSDAFVKALNKQIEEMCPQSIAGDDVIDVPSVIRTLTFDVVYGLAMGVGEKQSELFDAAEKLCQLADRRVYSGWARNKWLSDVLGETSKIAKHRNVFTQYVKEVLTEERDGDVTCLLDALVYEGLSEDEIASTLLAFIILGYDRLASTTCFALMELSNQHEALKKIRNEINTQIDSVQRLESMKSLESFLLETQRLHPVTSVISKWVTEGIPLCGYFIPPNTSVQLYLYGTGRDAYQFSAPEKFDMNRKNLNQVFGANKRDEGSVPMTIMKSLVAHLCVNYQFKMEKENVAVGSGLTMRAEGVRFNVKSC